MGRPWKDHRGTIARSGCPTAFQSVGGPGRLDIQFATKRTEHPPPDVVERLKRHRAVADVPESELSWFAERAVLRRYAAPHAQVGKY